MERPIIPKVEDEDEEEDIKEGQNKRMQHKFRSLQRHWNEYTSCKQPKTYPPRNNLKRSSVQVINALDQLVCENSPRSLMASLQHQHHATLSSSSTWKVRNNELAAEENRRERKAVIQSGKLKGRRLSYSYGDDMDIEIDAGEDALAASYWDDGFVEERDEFIRSVPCSCCDSEEEEGGGVCLDCGVSYSSSASFSKMEEGGKLGEKEDEKAMASVNNQKMRKRGKRELAMVWVGIAWVTMVVIVSVVRRLGFGSYNNYEDDLVPT